MFWKNKKLEVRVAKDNTWSPHESILPLPPDPAITNALVDNVIGGVVGSMFVYFAGTITRDVVLKVLEAKLK